MSPWPRRLLGVLEGAAAAQGAGCRLGVAAFRVSGPLPGAFWGEIAQDRAFAVLGHMNWSQKTSGFSLPCKKNLFGFQWREDVTRHKTCCFLGLLISVIRRLLRTERRPAATAWPFCCHLPVCHFQTTGLSTAASPAGRPGTRRDRARVAVLLLLSLRGPAAEGKGGWPSGPGGAAWPRPLEVS